MFVLCIDSPFIICNLTVQPQKKSNTSRNTGSELLVAWIGTLDVWTVVTSFLPLGFAQTGVPGSNVSKDPPTLRRSNRNSKENETSFHCLLRSSVIVLVFLGGALIFLFCLRWPVLAVESNHATASNSSCRSVARGRRVAGPTARTTLSKHWGKRGSLKDTSKNGLNSSGVL